ncbi:helix-turn-helix domain-containing protein [Streptomyces acidiscabies]|uniref:XRE family transcriptional regulator n=1 Tax=Streptomyces acidiscabies TaxID=42234 RepID=A0A0L0JKV6_9ACTN|nr:helix-turn-helix transcriptional regulator [Streptomyces acidiscabies]KND26332.1 XRE family transcriptional regulator [Streptomyces acidiscabies]
MPNASDPSLNRRKLRLALKSARDKTGLTQREAADRLDWSLSKVIRIEAGTVSLSVTDLQAMVRLYEIEDAEIVEELEQAARGSKGQSWWSEYSDVVSPTFAQYLGYESAANTVRGYHPTLIPGLLQTADYMNALFAAASGATRVQLRTDLRLARQELVLADNGPTMAMILDESAVRRLVGGAGTMRNQLTHVKQLAEAGRITLQILPFSAGEHDSLEDCFVLFGYRDDEDVLYLAGPGGVLTNRDDREKVARYQECFEDLSDKALNQEESIALLDDILGQLNLS